MKSIIAYAIVNKKKPKIDCSYIFKDKKDITLENDEMWVKIKIEVV